MTIIYGIDTDKEITAIMARDAIIDCFYNAHNKQTGISNLTDKKTNEYYCSEIVQKSFLETGGNFNSPTKEDLKKAINWLANFSKNFRDNDTINKHIIQITDLIDMVKDPQ